MCRKIVQEVIAQEVNINDKIFAGIWRSAINEGKVFNPNFVSNGNLNLSLLKNIHPFSASSKPNY